MELGAENLTGLYNLPISCRFPVMFFFQLIIEQKAKNFIIGKVYTNRKVG
jgi:hypothetical protein